METVKYVPDLLALTGEIPEQSIVSRTFHTGEAARAMIFGFAAGEELSEHTSTKTAIIHILSGEAKLKLGEEEHMAKAGAWAYMPPNLPHSVFAISEVRMLLLMF
ncbi:MAG: cupin domain-containing protein [Anaerolineae bacterium]|nr:cupin domain-containing protein [Anaerolineae bacterium]